MATCIGGFQVFMIWQRLSGMKWIYCCLPVILLSVSCQRSGTPETSSFPSIFLVKESIPGFTSVTTLRDRKMTGHQASLWQDFELQAKADLEIPYLDPTVDFPGRSPVHLRHKNVSYDMAKGVCERLFRLSLKFLVTEDEQYKDLVMRQIEVLYDPELWPDWCDQSHMRHGTPYVDIRTFRISMWVALAYNWLHDYWTEEQRQFIIDGLDRRAIQPFWEKLAQKPFWYEHRHNWFTNIFGGMAITAMALGDAHPETQKILDTVVPEMIAFNDFFGEQGEFNEPPGYAGAVRFSTEFAEAYRYYTQNERNLLNEKPFPEVCYWVLNHTLPPGRLTAFGDSQVDRGFSSMATIAAAANANRDPVLQWYYLNYSTEMQSPFELLWYDPDLEPVNPAGKLPLAVNYPAYGADLISRTSWDPKVTSSVVYGKAGREANHDDNDVGQLCIDGYGERLIIDVGKPEPIYPLDYFGATQYNYYTRSSRGHNVLVVGGEEMKAEPNEEARGKTLNFWADDEIGSYWQIDLSPVYENAQRVIRTVAHVHPGLVLVHDLAELPQPDSLSLRWHTIKTPEFFMDDQFRTHHERAAIVGKVISLDGERLQFSTGHHAFQPPYHLTRQNDPLVQNYEPFVRVDAHRKTLNLLSLFSVYEAEGSPPQWTSGEGSWVIDLKDEKFKVEVQEAQLVISRNNEAIMQVPMPLLTQNGE